MKIIIAGDFCPCGRIAKCIYNDKLAGLIDNDSLPIRSSYAIVNLECPIVSSETVCPIIKEGPNLYTTPIVLDVIKKMGFDSVSLANNHFRDYGDEGCVSTLNALKARGIDYVGGGKNIDEASKILYKNFEDGCLAVINCCEHEFSIATEKRSGANPIEPIKQFYQIKEAKAKADYVIIITHSGHEGCQIPSLRMKENYRFFIDAGADAVVNHHQHCFGPYEYYKGKPIFYGLGNFCFDGDGRRNSKWNEGYIVVLNFVKDKISSKVIPYEQCNGKPGVFFLKDRTEFDKKLGKLNSIIAESKRHEETLNRFYISNPQMYRLLSTNPVNMFVYKIFNKIGIKSLISKRWALAARNLFECESHCDRIICELKNKTE